MSKEEIIEQAEKLIKAGKYDKAIKEYQKLLEEDPSDMRAKLKIGDLYAKNKEMPNALKNYREVADYYSQENFHLKAIAVYKTVLKLSPSAIEVNGKLGALYHEVGLDQDAINQYYIVAGYYDGKGMLKESMEVRKKILEIDPSNTTSRIRLAELMQQDGKTEDSLHEYEQAASVLTSKKDREALIEVYEKMLYYRPDNVDMLVDLCRIYFEKREFKRALRRIELAPASSKNSLDILGLWAEALLEERQVDASRKKFKELYTKSLETQDAERSAKVYSRILQEFNDDEDYLKELEEMRKNTGMEHEKVKPKYRQDFESTQMVDLSKMDELMKKK